MTTKLVTKRMCINVGKEKTFFFLVVHNCTTQKLYTLKPLNFLETPEHQN